MREVANLSRLYRDVWDVVGDTPRHARNAVEGRWRPGNITFVSHNILGSVDLSDTRCSV